MSIQQSRMREFHARTRSDRYGESVKNGVSQSRYEPRMQGNWNQPIPRAYACQPEHYQRYYDHNHGHNNAGWKDQRRQVQIEPSCKPKTTHNEEALARVIEEIKAEMREEWSTTKPSNSSFFEVKKSAEQSPIKPQIEELIEINNEVKLVESFDSEISNKVKGIVGDDSQVLEACIGIIQEPEREIQCLAKLPQDHKGQIQAQGQVSSEKHQSDLGEESYLLNGSIEQPYPHEQVAMIRHYEIQLGQRAREVLHLAQHEHTLDHDRCNPIFHQDNLGLIPFDRGKQKRHYTSHESQIQFPNQQQSQVPQLGEIHRNVEKADFGLNYFHSHSYYFPFVLGLRFKLQSSECDASYMESHPVNYKEGLHTMTHEEVRYTLVGSLFMDIDHLMLPCSSSHTFRLLQETQRQNVR